MRLVAEVVSLIEANVEVRVGEHGLRWKKFRRKLKII